MSTELTVADPGRFETALPLSSVRESKTNPRRDFDALLLQELADSIRTKGLLQPIVVRPLNGGLEFELVCGTRRLRAAKLAGLEALPASVRVLSDQEVLEIQVIENLQRTDLHALEEARGYQQLLATKGYDVARIAERVGRSVKYVYDRLKLVQLTKEAQKLFLDGRFTAGHAILLARLKPEDQKRAIDPEGAGGYHSTGLFTGERGLWDPDVEEAIEKEDPYACLKPVSVRELQAWIDQHVKADRDQVDPILFPETAVMVGSAKEQGEKIVPIMKLSQTPDAARGTERIFSERSWKRADGENGSKTCDHAKLGMVTIGPGRNEAFRVCIAKEKCTTHWADFVKSRKQLQKAAAKAVAKGEDPRKAEERSRKEQEAKRAAEEARWAKAMPAIWSAIAAAVRKAPARAGGLLADIVIKGVGFDDWMRRQVGVKPESLVPRGNTAEDLVRHAAFLALMREVVDPLGMDTDAFAKRARAFGVDVRKILDQAAPASAKDRACRFCGCTEKKACSTIGGPCTWLSADVCSAAACETKLQAEGKKKPAKKGGSR